MNKEIQHFSKRLRETLLNGGSINKPDKNLWTETNFENLYKAMVSSPKEGEKSFVEKISEQINEAGKANLTVADQEPLWSLVVELLGLYFVFPSNITKGTKQKNLEQLINNSSSAPSSPNLNLKDFEISKNALLSGGIGSCGMGYNTNRWKEISYLIDVLKDWFKKSSSNRDKLLNKEKGSNIEFQNFLDDVADNCDFMENPQTRHILLHLLFPSYYAPITSTSQKNAIKKVFSGFFSEAKLKNEWSETEPKNLTDQKIRVISESIAELRGKPTDFYDDPEIAILWDSSSSEIFPDLDIELLEYKKQIVLYGPPGTSKTYTAKKLAKEIIRYKMAKDIGPKIFQEEGQKQLSSALDDNIKRLQLHPSYSYEDFVGGVQFVDGNTSFKKGELLQLLEKMNSKPELPHALILDEINRVDLSRLLGECFSALEDRGESINLLSSKVQLMIPDNLYIIGTMNLIDHSVEQLDFALRRRFLWIKASYNADALLAICKEKWENLKWDGKKFSWDLVEADFKRLVKAANKINNAIGEENELGEDFMLGHTFFTEAVPFLHQFLQLSPSSRSYLYTKQGDWREPIKKLWRLSLSPLLKEYLSGLDNDAQKQIMKKLKEAFRP